jgi:hypothetical protein
MSLVSVPLDSAGKIYDKNLKADTSHGGLIAALKNHLIRGITWNLFTFTFHSQTGEMCLADERGQVYLLKFNENIYYSLRLASRPILCLEFIHSRPSNLLVGYANGFTICIDTASNEIKSTLYPKGSDPICLIRCSPTKPFAVMLSLSGKLSLWDLGHLTTVRRMEIPEPIVDLFFLKSGSHIAITFQTLGVIIYSLSDSMSVESRCTTPPRSVSASCRHLTSLLIIVRESLSIGCLVVLSARPLPHKPLLRVSSCSLETTASSTSSTSPLLLVMRLTRASALSRASLSSHLR